MIQERTVVDFKVKKSTLLVSCQRFGTLLQRRVRRFEIAHERRLFITPEIEILLNGGEVGKGFPHVFADLLLDRFMAGHYLGVSLIGTSGDDVDLEKLDGLDEVWVFRIRKPKPGWRIFGRFIGKDCFICLMAMDRTELGQRKKYEMHATAVIDAWDRLLPVTGPHRGAAISDYIGGGFNDVDDIRE